MDLHVIPAFRRFEVQFSLGEGYTPIHGYGIVPEGNLQNVVWGVTLEDLPLHLITPLINQLGGERLAEYLERIPPIRISTQFYGEFSSQTRIVDVPAFTIQEESESQNRVRGSFRYENGSFNFPVLDFQWKGYGGTAVVQGKEAGGEAVEFNMDLALEDIRYRFHAFIDPKGYVRITGSNDSKLELHWGKNTGMFGSLSLQELPLNFIAPEVRVSCKADFFYESRDRWVLDIGILQTNSILLPSGEKAEVSLSGTILPGQGSFQFLRLKDSISDLQGNGSAFFSMDGTMIQIRVFLEDTRQNERYTLVCSWDQGSGSAELELTNSPLVRFFPGHGIEG
ncbi:MAG TPA: hypothetical protein PLG79_15600, partial [Spirochaetales bacterium]|nr:hypothetical protein [Spirochaetales bacterium]